MEVGLADLGFKPTPSRRLKACFYVFNCVILTGLAPIIARVFGFQFLPAPSWVKLVSSAGTGLGLAFAVFVSVLVYLSPRKPPKPDLAAFAVLPPVGFIAAQMLVTTTLPMVLALLFGSDMSAKYQVEQQTQFLRCPAGVSLAELPFVTNVLGRLPQDFLAEVKPGQPITVSGRGTAYGLFAREVAYREADK